MFSLAFTPNFFFCSRKPLPLPTRKQAMLPTPSTSHVAFERIYEPAEDSYLLLDTLSSESEKKFLRSRFHASSGSSTQVSSSPIVAEIGTGSGVVLAFINAHASVIFDRKDIVTIGIDVNRHACYATTETVKIASVEHAETHGFYLDNVLGDLSTPLRNGLIDVLIFNPPYVPTAELPDLANLVTESYDQAPSFERDSHLLSLSYAGGPDGMETTHRLLHMLSETLSVNGVAYILLCAQNRPAEVKNNVEKWGPGWKVETVGSSGKSAGWEKLQIIRIWRTPQ